ncbi:hypothetical protein N9414_01025 [Nodularia spumigena CCY9414]|nr:hypothetical protein N9414_01025 [Nodularia spumigena CCY9414]
MGEGVTTVRIKMLIVEVHQVILLMGEGVTTVRIKMLKDLKKNGSNIGLIVKVPRLRFLEELLVMVQEEDVNLVRGDGQMALVYQLLLEIDNQYINQLN